MASFLIVCLAVSLACCRVDGSTGQKQTCRSTAPDTYGRDGFLCPVDLRCKSASQRCLGPSSRVCARNGEMEEGCGYDTSRQQYKYYLGKSSLSSSSSSSSSRTKRGYTRCLKLLVYKFYHNFVDYRGFTFEFGRYGVQVLDKNDLNYKYRAVALGGKKVTGYTYKGTSDCTYEELKTFVQDYWNGEYDLCDNNCQDFAQGLTKILSNNCAMIRANRPQGTDAVLPDNLVAYFRQITVGSCFQRLQSSIVDSTSPATVSAGAVATVTGLVWMYSLVAVVTTIVVSRGL